MPKRYLATDVLTAANARIRETLVGVSRAYISFSGGKDSTVMLHLVMSVAQEIGSRIPIAILFVDLEGQYKKTISHIENCVEMYRASASIFWVCLPLNLRNAVSAYEPHWQCWEPGRSDDWIRQPPKGAILDEDTFPFFSRGMEFEEFTPSFAEWYAQGEATACFVGIRTQESLNRWRTLASVQKSRWRGRGWTTKIYENVFNAYPIYDWTTEDIWTYHARNADLPTNEIYELMHRAGLSIHQQRICQPYGDDQRKGLWLFHVIEPETWGRVLARVNGANQGALYSRTTGNMLGLRKVTLPPGHTWESFTYLLLESLPEKTAEHYKNKIAVFINWWMRNGNLSHFIPDEADPKLEAAKKTPSWRRICKAILRNDYWCKGLSFTQQSTESYAKYNSIIRKRRGEWGIFSPRPDGPTFKQLAVIASLDGGYTPDDAYAAIGRICELGRTKAKKFATKRDASDTIHALRKRGDH